MTAGFDPAPLRHLMALAGPELAPELQRRLVEDLSLRLHPSHEPRRGNRPPLRVRLTTSGETRSHGVTGGVYKTRERIHRDMLIHDY